MSYAIDTTLSADPLLNEMLGDGRSATFRYLDHLQQTMQLWQAERRVRPTPDKPHYDLDGQAVSYVNPDTVAVVRGHIGKLYDMLMEEMHNAPTREAQQALLVSVMRAEFHNKAFRGADPLYYRAAAFLMQDVNARYGKQMPVAANGQPVTLPVKAYMDLADDSYAAMAVLLKPMQQELREEKPLVNPFDAAFVEFGTHYPQRAEALSAADHKIITQRAYALVGQIMAPFFGMKDDAMIVPEFAGLVAKAAKRYVRRPLPGVANDQTTSMQLALESSVIRQRIVQELRPLFQEHPEAATNLTDLLAVSDAINAPARAR